MFNLHVKTSFVTRVLALSAAILCCTNLFAQKAEVRGVVSDESGEPVVGAFVVISGTTTGTATDVNGAYVISAESGATLEFSAIGYNTQTITVGKDKVINVVLSENAEFLNEVVVIGYGTLKKKDLTGSVASVSSKEFTATPISNVGQALQGKLAGVQVLDSGSPGSDVTVRVRGLGTINDSSPLVVVDGVPTGGLNFLNMNDIERVDVLKDASATAIYGSRGANGVLLITTKRGAKGEGNVNVTANVALANATNVPQLLNASEYAAFSNDLLSNAGIATNPDWADPSKLGEGTNWLGEMLQTGIKQDYSLSYSGGNEANHYYISGGFVDQKGIVKTTSFQRFNVQVNNDNQVKKWLKFTSSITFSANKSQSGSYSISNAMKSLPTLPVKNEDGTWSGPEGTSYWYGDQRNPIGPMYEDSNWGSSYKLLANIAADINITSWLKFRSNFGFDGNWSFNDSWTPKYDYKPIAVEQSSRYAGNSKSMTYLWDNYFTFDKNWGKHHLDIMAGTSAQWNNYNYMNGTKKIFEFDAVHELNNGQEISSLNGSSSSWALMSGMGRFNYSYADRYLLTATVRADGSSRFGEKNRWGVFPSGSFAWRISKEEWFKSRVINDFKFRIGYGVTGNQNIGNYGYIASYNTGVYSFNGNPVTALVSSTLANPNIHWEQVSQSNIGVDMSFFDSRINFSLDGYLKNTSEMLVKASIPITSGFEDTSTTYTNAGKVSNKGVEFFLHTVNFKGEFYWDTDLVVSYNSNQIVSLNSDKPMYINQVNNAYLTMLDKGYPINVFYGYVTDGIFQNQEEVNVHAVQAGAGPGDIRFRDLNNDGVINADDRTVIGDPNPDFLFSMNNRLTYKGFELILYLQGVAGNEIYNANNISNEGMSSAYNQTKSVLNRWRGEGTSTTMPRAVWGDPNDNARVSTRFIEDGSYLRIKNLTIAYNLPDAFMRKIHFNSAKVYCACENLATFTSYSGFDPEVALNGIDSSRYPISRTISFGLNLNF